MSAGIKVGILDFEGLQIALYSSAGTAPVQPRSPARLRQAVVGRCNLQLSRTDSPPKHFKRVSV